jgi:hypothetical protein
MYLKLGLLCSDEYYNMTAASASFLEHTAQTQFNVSQLQFPRSQSHYLSITLSSFKVSLSLY